MAVLNFIINNILTQAAVVIGLIACLGLALQKKSLGTVVSGTLKTMLGFLVLSAGSSVIQSSLSFFGTAFTIMAFHNDVGIHDVFARLYEMTMGQKATGITTLEVAYSLGLAIGITLFFNHVGGRRITADPTPIEVEMRIYEKDVDDTLIETADREGKTIDAS